MVSAKFGTRFIVFKANSFLFFDIKMLPGAYKRKYGMSGGSTSRALVVAGPRTFYRGTRMSRVKRARKRNIRTAGYLGIETKFFDTAVNGTALGAPTDATGGEIDPTTLLCLNCPSQGDGESQRDGRQIAMKSLHIKGNVIIPKQSDQATLDNGTEIYLAVVLDKQTNGAQLDSEAVFTNPSGSGNLAASPFRNLQYGKRFTVLKSWKTQVSNLMSTYDGTNIEQSGLFKPFSFNISLKNMKVNFTNTTSVIGNIADNSIHVIGYCSNTELAPIVFYNSRLRFVG